MYYISHYYSKLGDITLTADDTGLTGLFFTEKNRYLNKSDVKYIEKETSVIKDTKKWLDIYFSGKEPPFSPVLNPSGSEFRLRVFEILREIPYGTVISYKDIALKIASERNLKKISAQAVGGAVGHNNILIIIPCHRVIGANKNLTGYGPGIDIKIKLLEIEGRDVSEFSLPKNYGGL